MTIDPRKDFQASPHKPIWSDFSASATFAAAAQAALVQYQINLGTSTDVSNAGANGFKLVGAKQFLDVLMSLTETPTPTPVTNSRANLKPI